MNSEEEKQQNSSTNAQEVHTKKQAVPSFLLGSKQTQLISQREEEVNAEEEVKVPSSFIISTAVPYQPNLIVEEFERELKLLHELKDDLSKKSEFLAKLENFTQRVDFQQELASNESYIGCWLEYSMSVKDQDKSIRFMLDHGIGNKDPKVHLNLAFFYEKYKRDFTQSEKVYTQALALEGTSEVFKKVIMKKYHEFSKRMQERINRDIISKLGEETFNQRVQSKKRKLSEAFPNMNESGLSDGSNSSKKRRFNQEISQYHETLVLYQDGITYLKQTQPDFQELAVNEQSLKELEARPLSWITKHELFNLTNEIGEASQISDDASKFQFSVENQEKKTNAQPIDEKFEELKLEQPTSQNFDQSRKSRDALVKAQQANVRVTTLQTIGETSLDGHSNASALYNNSLLTKQTVRLEESKQSMEESLVFKTANNSSDQIDKDLMIQLTQTSTQQVEQDKVTSILQQLTSLFAPQQSTQVQDLLQQILNLQKEQQTASISQDKENIKPQFQQSFCLNSEPMPTQQTQKNQLQPTQIKKESPCREQSEKKRMSDIFMKVFEEGEKKRESNLFQPSASPKPQPPELTFSNFMKKLYQPIKKPEEAKRQSDVQSNNVSIFEATPHESKFSKHINANYSQEFFMKKKTLSKVRPEARNESMANEQDQFMSPFGLVSPMDNKTRARDSNVMKDCCGLEAFVPDHLISQPNFMTLMYQQVGFQPQTQQFSFQHQYQPYQPTYSAAQSVFSNYTGKDKPKPSLGIVPTSAPQVVKRESADSEGLVFQDCVNDFNALNQKRQTDSVKLPSALKPSNTEEQSRNGSKSVRFVNQ